MTDTAHAKLSASGAHRWISCPGSINAEEGLPDSSSEFAREGTAAHTLGEECLSKGYLTADYLGGTIDGHTVTPEMVEAVGAYVQTVNDIPGARLIESRVDYSRWVPDGFGTADAIVVDDDHMHVIDLKYGKGVPVSAENNPQGLLYALGAYDLVSDWAEIKTVTITIVQPRIVPGLSTWTISKSALLKKATEIKKAAKAALAENAPRVPSVKACKFCKAKPTCRALADQCLGIAQAGFEDLDSPLPLQNAVDLSDTEISKGSIVPIEDPAKNPVYAGCYVNAKISLWIQDSPKFGKRINANIVAVQFEADGEALSSRLSGAARAEGFDGDSLVDDGDDDFLDLDDAA